MAKAPEKYQPERTDILINTDWGIPGSALSPEEADSRNLINYGGRWVTRQEDAILRRQRAAYLLIKWYSLFLLLNGLFELFVMPGMDTLIWGPLLIATACGFAMYRRWAYWLVMIRALFWFIAPALYLVAHLGGGCSDSKSNQGYGLSISSVPSPFYFD